MPPLDPSHLGLAHLFQQTALLRMFMAFAASRCAEENVLFLRDVKEWERSLRGSEAGDAKGARASAKFMVSANVPGGCQITVKSPRPCPRRPAPLVGGARAHVQL